jgi:hypothetical protein
VRKSQIEGRFKDLQGCVSSNWRTKYWIKGLEISKIWRWIVKIWRWNWQQNVCLQCQTISENIQKHEQEKFKDFQVLLYKFKDIQGLEFLFSNSFLFSIYYFLFIKFTLNYRFSCVLWCVYHASTRRKNFVPLRTKRFTKFWVPGA